MQYFSHQLIMRERFILLEYAILGSKVPDRILLLLADQASEDQEQLPGV
jgi:hypothetical protein